MCALLCSAEAATLTSTISKENKTVIALTGEIVEGDSNTLASIIRASNEAGREVSGLRLNSLGGNLGEGARLAQIVAYAKIAAVVANGSTCASACFIVFAAGTEKYASFGASVGVHGASDKSGRETTSSNAATVLMARLVKDYGVPSAIIGRMVVTPPEEIVWLSPSELRSMGATLTGKPSQSAPTAALQPTTAIQPTSACHANKTYSNVEGFSRARLRPLQ
jgi:hypothetical protein